MSIKAGSFLPEIKAGEKHKSTQQHRHSDQNSPCSHTISKDDIERFRNSNKHNVCVEMLRKGYHRSFSEMFSLLQQWESSRSAAGPGSALWLQTPLDSQPDHLNALQHHLTQAEEASRSGLWCSVYDHQVSLAEYFSSPEDSWLKVHFYQKSFQTSSSIHDQQTHAAACANMANVYVEQGRGGEARQMCDMLSQVKVHDTGVCVSVWRLHCRLAQDAMAAGDLPLGVEHLHKAYDITTQAGDVIIEGDTAYRLGSAYQAAGDLITARKFLNIYVDISSSLGDAAGLGKAYKTLAMCMESEGRLDETLQYMEKFVAVSHSNRTLEDAVSPSNQLQYSQQEAVSPSNQLQYSQQEAVSPSNQLQYSQQEDVSPSNQLQYSQQKDVSPSNQLQYSQQEAVSPSNHLQYSQQKDVSPSNQLQYSQQDAVSPSNQLQYSQQEAVSPSNQLQYSQQKDVSPSNQLQYSQQKDVSPSNQLQYSQQEAVSPSNHLQYSQQDACMCLGQLYYRRGQYDQSCEYFQQGYGIACSLGEMDLVEKAQVMVGCARAHSLTQKHSADVGGLCTRSQPDPEAQC